MTTDPGQVRTGQDRSAGSPHDAHTRKGNTENPSYAVLPVLVAIDDPWEMMIFRRLREAADAGAMCPTADDLSELIGSESVAATVGVMQRLERKGLIVVERYQRTRRVTIVSTGAKTMEPTNTAPHWREIAVTLGTLRRQRPGDAQAIIFEATRRKMRVADFLSDLVWAGWGVIQVEMVEG